MVSSGVTTSPPAPLLSKARGGMVGGGVVWLYSGGSNPVRGGIIVENRLRVRHGLTVGGNRLLVKLTHKIKKFLK